MRRINASAYPGPLFLSLLVLASTALHAQAPAAGTTVSVKMIDTVNSGSDPAGKQYRASVAKAVTAANGIAIPQGAAATVTLTSSGSNYATQLSSITINGQVVAVTSNSASANSAAQSAVSSAAASAVGSVLGGFGHHVSAPASVAIAATGQHISLPTGTTLTFVLGASPALAAPAPSSSQPVTAAQPASNSLSNSSAASGASAGDSLTAMYICQSNPPPNPSDPGYGKIYLTAAFEVPVATEGSIPVIEPAFSAYLQGDVPASERRNQVHLDLDDGRRPGRAKKYRRRSWQDDSGRYRVEVWPAAAQAGTERLRSACAGTRRARSVATPPDDVLLQPDRPWRHDHGSRHD